MSTCKDLVCGASIPKNNPHAVSVSLPKLEDVIGYEEGDFSVLDAMQSGYPRFFRNGFVKQLEKYIRKRYAVADNQLVFPVSSLKSYEILCCLLQEKLTFVKEDAIYYVLVSKEYKKLQDLKGYVQNAGLIVSSRQAEKSLFDLNLIDAFYEEERVDFVQGLHTVSEVLSEAYQVNEEAIVLTNNGANAVFAICEGLLASNVTNKKGILQLGWLYLDTMEVIRKRGQEVFPVLDVFDLDAFERYLQANHAQIGFVVAEIVSNPKIECVDIACVYAICKRYDVLLVLDATLATPFHVAVMQYCDVAVESLSKFACGHADVLMGAIVCKNPKLLSEINRFVVSPYGGEIERLGVEIVGYKERLKKISVNTKKLVDFFSKEEKVKKVLSVHTGTSKEIYQRIAQSFDIPGLVSVVFEGKLSDYYDALPFAKGPSLGTEFTLAMPYVYLAHYDLVKTAEGRNYLNENGIDAELLRISVGVEPIEKIIEAFKKVFKNEILAIV